VFPEQPPEEEKNKEIHHPEDEKLELAYFVMCVCVCVHMRLGEGVFLSFF
jgi:hypothetical protein